MSLSADLPPGTPARVPIDKISFAGPASSEEVRSGPPSAPEGRRVALRFLPNGRYEFLAGRAELLVARRNGETEIDAQVYVADDRQAGLVTLVEGVRRGELSLVEEARLVATLRLQHKVRQRELGALLDRHQSSISHLLRLLDRLTPEVLVKLEQGALSMGHAKVLMGVPKTDQLRWLDRALQGHWSVQVLSQRIAERPEATDRDLARLAQDLTEVVGCRVQIDHRTDGRGRICIEYYSLEEAEGVIARLRTTPIPNEETPW